MSDDYSDDSLFNISSWGADLSFREIINMYTEEELLNLMKKLSDIDLKIKTVDTNPNNEIELFIINI